ncbi:hypothetical protein MUK42_36771 [Musa troglodytarum]|uniref:Uncharacterized protein n=1 Tax=Musa troglodytarum TaxID=320322 RepID=A0A9E7KC83_9LILI|nr:hypothetical protein MUK42_36771 [Musa troglodytarum]
MVTEGAPCLLLLSVSCAAKRQREREECVGGAPVARAGMLPPLLLYHLLRRRVLPSEVSAPRPGLSRDLTAADPPRVCVCVRVQYIYVQEAMTMKPSLGEALAGQLGWLCRCSAGQATAAATPPTDNGWFVLRPVGDGSKANPSLPFFLPFPSFKIIPIYSFSLQSFVWITFSPKLDSFYGYLDLANGA